VLGRPGDDLLSQVLRHSTIGAEEFNGRVRDGIGFRLLAKATRPAKDTEARGFWLSCGCASRGRRSVWDRDVGDDLSVVVSTTLTGCESSTILRIARGLRRSEHG
jgi:hypothetical protein